MSEDNLHEIDIEKAAGTLHAHYFVRLMWALNDLLALHHLQVQNDKSKEENPYLWNSSLIYIIKMTSGHLFEAVENLVVRYAPRKSKQEPIYSWIAARPNLLQKFNAVNALCNKKQEFSYLAKIRNTFVFHYNYSEGAKVTANAIEQRVKELKQLSGKAIGHLHLDLNRPHEYRFLVADEILSAAWRALTNVPFCADYASNPETQEQYAYRRDLGIAFVDFAEACIVEWIHTNQLQTGPQQ